MNGTDWLITTESFTSEHATCPRQLILPKPVVNFHPVGVQTDLHLLADEAGGNPVAPSRYLDGAPPAHLGPIIGVFRHWSWRQGPYPNPPKG